MTGHQQLPDTIANEEALDELLSRPSPKLVAMMKQLNGDIIVLGIAGKMGVTLGMTALRAIKEAGAAKRVIGVSRFSSPGVSRHLEVQGIETIQCDLLDRESVASLPKVKNVVYMAGKKFGTQGEETVTWATNVIAPYNAAHHFRESRIVVFSTGCVYPLVPAATGGCTEEDPPFPVGEYAQSCLGRERVFDYGSRTSGTPVCLMRLNYAVDLRYGVLHDIGKQVYQSRPVDLTVSHFNVIWQGDANRQALLCLGLCSSPPTPINVTGPETISVRFVAQQFARIFGVEPLFTANKEDSRMYLSNAAKAVALFGHPTISLLQIIRWQAAWIQAGGRSLDKPTHFEVTDGRF
jgi:nucleoside-diphosphate-sugar epimerase